MRAALSCLRKRGTYVHAVCRSTGRRGGGGLPFKDRRSGFWCCNTSDMEKHGLIASGRIPVENASRVIGIEDIREAFDTLIEDRSGDVKIQVSFE